MIIKLPLKDRLKVFFGSPIFIYHDNTYSLKVDYSLICLAMVFSKWGIKYLLFNDMPKFLIKATQ
jgi:hypothetical protein